MTYEEIAKPLEKGEARIKITAGFIPRGGVRRDLMGRFLQFHEEKSFMVSTFYVRGSVDKILQFVKDRGDMVSYYKLLAAGH